MPVESAKSIKQLNADAKALLVEAKNLYDKGDDATPDELKHADKLTADAESIVKSLEGTAGNHQYEALKTINRIENTISILERPDRLPSGAGGDGASLTPVHGPGSHAIKSLGQQLISDERFTDWLKSIAPAGHIPQGVQVQSPPIAVKDLFTSAVDIAASRPMLGQPDRRAEIVPIGWTPRILRSLVTNSTTQSDSVEVVRAKTQTNNAATVGEAIDVSDGSGEKPQSYLDWELITVAVQTIAHWVAYPTRVLSDARRLRSETDSFLREGIEQENERQMLVGTGTNEYVGIRNTTGILTQAWVATGDHPILTTSRKARTKLRVSGRAMPNAWVFHPNDWETIDLLTDGEERYLYQGPFNMGMPRLWGVPVVESEYETEGFAVLGDWTQAVLYDREQTTISMSNSHADFFIRNLVAILGELRAAFHVRRPKSFIDVDVVA
jgi:HK97 family phage major capsid protein